MLYGLASAPSVFKNMINEVLRDYLHKIVFAYIDNIYRPDLASHMKHMRLVLQKLLHHELYVKGEKCEFLKESI